MRSLIVLIVLLTCGAAAAQEQPPDHVPYKAELPSGLRAWYRNPDG